MVNNSGPSLSQGNHLNEAEKRRKYSMERAKASHLSRQLQMRLQYARLKVEHGWQNQNLNEVENLYFRHSHQRGPKPYPSPSLLAATTQPTKADSFTSPLNTQSKSSLSFKLGAFNAPHVSDPSSSSSSSNSLSSLPVISEPQSSQDSASNATMQTANMPEKDAINSVQDTDPLTPNVIPPVVQAQTSPLSYPSIPYTPTYQPAQTTTPQISAPIILVDPSPPNNPPLSTKSSWAESYLNKGATSLNTAPEGTNVAANTATSSYDSFWSSHSAWTLSNSFRTSSVGNMLPDGQGVVDMQTRYSGGISMMHSLDSGVLGKTNPATVQNGGT